MIEVEHLTKRYGGQTAVDDVSFRCEPGTVTGFLGPNGAGKSTTMRMICGLTPPTAGTATVLETHYRDAAQPGPPRRRAARRLGAAHGPHRAGGAPPRRAGPRRRERPGGRAARAGRPGPEAPPRKRVGTYSLGMRQRLGIAHALLGDPSVLILDEPANGLDPEGIFWMRGLLRDFADRGGTVLLSSHLLREVEAIADQLVVIGDGRVVAQGRKEELLAGDRRAGARARPAGAGCARSTQSGSPARRRPDGGLLVDAPAETVGRAAADAGVVLLELRPADGAGLEELFLTLTAGEPIGATA